MRYRVWIDRGGTFTDCICQDVETGRLRVKKLLSSSSSVVEGIRQVLGLAGDAAIPASDVRMGTTIATNALLERKGRASLLVVSRGFKDVFAIGTQARPDLFALDLKRPPPLYQKVIEVDARGTPNGAIQQDYSESELLDQLIQARATGLESVAIVLLHAHVNGAAELRLAELATRAGFQHVALSHQVDNELGFLARGDTTNVDAYLTPLLSDYLKDIRSALPESSVRLMQSSGGLTSAEALRGPHAILSGPAGGVVALAKIASAAGYEEVIGFDMGGTSTDVSRYAGSFERRYDSEIAGVRLRAPMLAIHTVAAGGGSLCRYDGQSLSVGPESAGADPGPLCYGAPAAREPALTDINLVLGRLQADRFPLPLSLDAAQAGLDSIVERLRCGAHPASRDSVAHDFFVIANLNMAEAIRKVSVQKGYDVRKHALFVFGGAGGQHACAIARLLGMRAVLFHDLSGVLSAYGMGLSDVTVHGQAHVTEQSLTNAALESTSEAFTELEARAIDTLVKDGFSKETIEHRRLVDLRYQGTETSLTLEFDSATHLEQTFHMLHQLEFGYNRPKHAIKLVQLRTQATANSPATLPQMPDAGALPLSLPKPVRLASLAIARDERRDVPVYFREQLEAGHQIPGPAIVLQDTGTIVVEAGFALTVRGALLVAEYERGVADTLAVPGANLESSPKAEHDPALLEVMSHSFMSIAEQMGHVLRRTAISTNIRERLDFSCAVFDESARLVANAPHIPVHLGAMGESVKAVVAAYPEMQEGDVFITNDPAHGGSHLPDVTVVTPVHRGGRVVYFVASRGHHADIGGITPGSMPADSRRLAEEGALLPALRLVQAGEFDRKALLQRLTSGQYPARDPNLNLADIDAQIAANRLGEQRLLQLTDGYGLDTVTAYMRHVQLSAERKVREAISQLKDGSYQFEDHMDSGAKIRVAIEISGSEMSIDFKGTDPQLESNLNAPRAVTVAAVIYFLRTLVDSAIPLNAGCLNPVTLMVPEGSLLAPDPDRAVVGGNVETSQRIVDVLLGAVGKAAASQGTMNNLSFGNSRFGYYETIAGGAGAGPGFPGAWGMHTHMTNTRITDAEVLETLYPVRLIEFSRRHDSGGDGLYSGGDGLVRELEFLEQVTVSLLTERRHYAPFGLAGGSPGATGQNLLNGKPLPNSLKFDAQPGDRLRLLTPGGGGYGQS